MYNLLLPLAKQVSQGEAPLEKLIFFLESERLTAKQTLMGILGERAAQKLPEVQQLRKAWENHLETATRLGKAAVERTGRRSTPSLSCCWRACAASTSCSPRPN